MWIRLLASNEGNSQICKDLFLGGRQEIADDESQGLDRQFLGGVELNGARGSDDLRKISDRCFHSQTVCTIPQLGQGDPADESVSSGVRAKLRLPTALRKPCQSSC